ncbi:MAG TPA: chemotaxis protein CheW [Bacillota bacterium]|nr:chemotaxis protein CheW [Bacillota bacterium]
MTATIIQELLDQEEDTQKDLFLTFTLGKESYGIEIKNVTEIIGLQPVTEVPELPEYIKGIINLRGRIIPVMDARLRFKKPFLEYNDRTCVIVIEVNTISIGLIVDRVSEVISIPGTEIVAPPEIGKTENTYIIGIGKIGNDVKLILDCDELLNEAETSNLTTIKGEDQDEMVL